MTDLARPTGSVRCSKRSPCRRSQEQRALAAVERPLQAPLAHLRLPGPRPAARLDRAARQGHRRRSSRHAHTAVVEIQGVIAPGFQGLAPSASSRASTAPSRTPTPHGVVLRINSPGGSPVQAGYVNDEIRRLRAKYPDIPLYAVVEDLCASGGYYIAVAADRIYVDKASLVGSIGVIMDGLRLRGRDGQARHRAARLHRRRQQGLPRPVRSRESRAPRPRAADAGRDPPAVHQGRARRAAASA